MRSVPWVMVALPVKVQVPSSPRPQTWWPASMSIGLLRSEVRAPAAPQARAAMASATTAGLMLRDIAGAYLREEGDLLAVEIRLHATATHCKAGPGDGHDGLRGGAVGVGEQGQFAGFDAGRR